GLEGWTRPSSASRHLPTLWGGVTPVRRFAPPPHSVGRSYARPALRATSPLCGEELRPSGASRHLPTLCGGVTPLRRFAPPREEFRYGRGAPRRLPAAIISCTCSWTRVSTCFRIAMVTSVLCSVRSVTPLIACRISTF